MKRTFCDRCGNELLFHQDELVEDYPDKDICANCAVDIEILKAALVAAAIKGISLGQALKKWSEAYNG